MAPRSVSGNIRGCNSSFFRGWFWFSSLSWGSLAAPRLSLLSSRFLSKSFLYDHGKKSYEPTNEECDSRSWITVPSHFDFCQVRKSRCNRPHGQCWPSDIGSGEGKAKGPNKEGKTCLKDGEENSISTSGNVGVLR